MKCFAIYYNNFSYVYIKLRKTLIEKKKQKKNDNNFQLNRVLKYFEE
jgi:hypothetical protein